MRRRADVGKVGAGGRLHIGGVENTAKETGVAAHHIDQSSADLSRQADLLKREVARFLQQVRSDSTKVQLAG